MANSMYTDPTIGLNTLVRAWKKSVPLLSEKPDFELLASTVAPFFEIACPDAMSDDLTDTGDVSQVSSPTQHRERDWQYQRIEIWSEGTNLTNKRLVLVLPTLVEEGTDAKISRWTDIDPLTRANKPEEIRIKFHFQNLLGNQGASSGFEIRLTRPRDNHGQNFTQIVYLKLGDTEYVPKAKRANYVDLMPYLAGKMTNLPATELHRGEAGPLLSYLYLADNLKPSDASEKWSNIDGSTSLQIIDADSALPTLQVRDPQKHIAYRYDKSIAPTTLGNLHLPGNASVENLTQTACEAWLRRDPGSDSFPWTIQLNMALSPLWNAVRERYATHLADIRPTDRVTLLPKLRDNVAYDDKAVSQPDLPTSQVRPLRVTLGARFDPPSRGSSSEHLEVAFVAATVRSGVTVNVTATFELGSRTLIFDDTTIDAAHQSARELALQVKLKAKGVVEANPQATRLGSLDLMLSTNMAGLQSTVLRILDISEIASAPRFWANILLPVDSIVPGGQDGLSTNEYVPEGYYYSVDSPANECQIERRFTGSAPIVFVRDPAPGPQPLAAYWMEINESNPPDYSQTVKINLHARNASGAEETVVVLDSNPFLVATVKFDGLRRRPDNDIIARWNTGGRDGAGWQLFTEAAPFQLTLPPQVLGEEMPRDTEMDGLKNQALQFRLSPTATQTLEGSYTPQNYTEAPWNLRRLLGYPGQRDAGAGVVQLQYELLYGLSCVAKAPMLRLAELFSMLGAIPGRLTADPQGSASYTLFRETWSRYAELYNSRVTMLEPRWSGANYGRLSGAAGAAATPQVLTLTDGVSCMFRGQADLAYPAYPQDVTHPDGFDPNSEEFPEPGDRLRGGATWGFEAPRIYHATLRTNQSTSALLTGPYFSSVGGTGYQKASFNSGLTSVYSNTAVGRTFFYSVERLGRISVYHNLARHVIEYGRSVERSAQFPNQTEFGDRPVLRKLREYVQILEPKLPLSPGTTSLPEAGCVLSIEFKHDTIPVLSAWGSNVGDTGWKVPLWNAAADQTIYSSPDVVFNMAGAEGADVECRILEPEKLFFYTDTTANADADPHVWPLVESLDFTPLAVPPCNTSFPGSDLNQQPSYDTTHPVGLRPFTLVIQEGQDRVNLVHGRADKALGALVQSVTIQRLAGVVKGNLSTATTGYNAVYQGLQDAASHVRTEMFDSVRQASGKVDVTKLNALIQTVKTPFAQKVDLSAIKAQETAILGRWKAQLQGELQDVSDIVAVGLTSVSVLGQTLPNYIAAVKEAAEHTFIEIELRLESLPTAPNALFQAATAAATSLKSAATALTNVIASAQFQQDLAVLQSARGSQIDLNAVAQLLLPLRTVLDQTRSQTASRTEHWMPSLGAYVDSAEVQLNAASRALCAGSNAGTALADLKAALATPPAELAAYLANQNPTLVALKTAIRLELVDLKADLDSLPAAVLTDSKRLQAELDMRINRAKAALQTAITALGLGQFDALTGALLGGIPDPGALLQDAVQKLTALAGLTVSDWRRQAEGCRRDVEHALDRFTESILARVPPIYKNLPKGNAIPALLQRAFGKAPRIPNLDFSIPQGVGYFYDVAARELNITPLLSKVSGLGAALSPLATSLPSMQVLERMIPSKLEDFNLSTIFPHFAGLDLANLFPSLKMPAGAADHIHLTHGFDASARRAWVQADISLTLDQPATLFSIGPMAVQIPKGSFAATVRIQTDSQGQVVRTTTGAITGDWNLLVGGSPIITLVSTSLTFNDNGQLHFDVSPARVRLSALFKLLEDAVSSFSPPGSGFSFQLAPTGIQTQLALPIPPISFGTSGITNLSFSFLFGIDWSPEFAIRTGFSIGRRDAPFNLSIFILGGGGYFEAMARYLPGKSISCSVDISLAASASLAISLGPISGGVAIFLGTEIHFATGGGGSDLRIGIYIMLTGQVSILGIVSAYVGLRLEASYGGGRFIGRGEFSIRIKICWCFTLSVSEQVTMSLGSGGSGETAMLMSPLSLSLADATAGIVSDVPLAPLPVPDFKHTATLYINMIK